MWHWIDTFGRPSLAGVLLDATRALNERAQGLLLAGAAGIDRDETLRAVLGANAACWRLLRADLTAAQRTTLKRDLQRQRRAWPSWQAESVGAAVVAGVQRHVAGSGDMKAIRRLDQVLPSRRALRGRRKHRRALQRQRRWLDHLAAGPRPADSVLRSRVADAYRRARRGPPRPGQGLRRLEDLVHVEELIGWPAGPKTDWQRAAAARRELLGLGLQARALREMIGRAEGRWSSGARKHWRQLAARRQAELHRQMQRLHRDGFAGSVEIYGQALPWQVFSSLAGCSLGAGPKS